MSFYKSYRKYLFKRDTLLATASVFIVIGLLALLPLNTKVLNPIKTALEDFDFNDIAYAKLGKNNNTPIDNRIVIVNIGAADRAQLTGMIETINAAAPKVMGLDVQFENPREPESDSMLLITLKNTPRLIAASKIGWVNEHELTEQKGFIQNVQHRFGYVNFIGEDGGTIRYFSPTEEQNGHQYLSFAAALVKEAQPAIFNLFQKRKQQIEHIHYKRKASQYMVIDGQDLLDGKVENKIFHNKYVLMGYLNPQQSDVEDKHFTPMNNQIAGKSLPDMNGVVIHANILSMILDGAYIRKTPAWLNWTITILLAWLHISLFIRYYIDNHLWFHLVAKVAQIVSAIFFVYLSIMLFHAYALKIDMKMPIIVIIMAIDVIYFYEAFALWLHKKYNFQTVFYHKPH